MNSSLRRNLKPSASACKQTKGADAVGADAVLHAGADLALDVDQEAGRSLQDAEDDDDREQGRSRG